MSAEGENPTPLELFLGAAKEGDTATVLSLAGTLGVPAGDAVDALGNTALHWAAGHGHAETVDEILKAGLIAPDAPNQRRATPLHRAAAKHRADCCRALLAHGADVSACDADGMRPSQVARDPATAALLQNAEMAKEMGMGDESSGDDDES
eukprot:TRINITY_DN2354_c0_g1_i14.p3 TRINITY_DN2354_c0_g1~~TRINITY_DN2354_c0_g1_i14.p3  ORF type:complete len:151 (-),score=58.94 TRINITY_DN2354_c0_g1_i14:2518-2970(-)